MLVMSALLERVITDGRLGELVYKDSLSRRYLSLKKNYCSLDLIVPILHSLISLGNQKKPCLLKIIFLCF